MKKNSFFAFSAVLFALVFAAATVSCANQEKEKGAVPVSFNANTLKAFFNTEDTSFSLWCVAELAGSTYSRTLESEISLASGGATFEAGKFSGVPVGSGYTVTVSLYSEKGGKGICYAKGTSDEFSVKFATDTPVELKLSKSEEVDSYFFVANYGGGLTVEQTGVKVFDSEYGTLQKPASFEALCFYLQPGETNVQGIRSNIYFLTDVEVTNECLNIMYLSFDRFSMDLGGHTLTWSPEANENGSYQPLITLGQTTENRFSNGVIHKTNGNGHIIDLEEFPESYIDFYEISLETDVENDIFIRTCAPIYIDGNVSIEGLVDIFNTSISLRSPINNTLNILYEDFGAGRELKPFGEDSTDIDLSKIKLFYTRYDDNGNLISLAEEIPVQSPDYYTFTERKTFVPVQELYYSTSPRVTFIQYPLDTNYVGLAIQNDSNVNCWDSTVGPDGEISIAYLDSDSSCILHTNGNMGSPIFNASDMSYKCKIGAIYGDPSHLLILDGGNNVHLVDKDSNDTTIGEINISASTSSTTPPSVTSLYGRRNSDGSISVYYSYTDTELANNYTPVLAKGTFSQSEADWVYEHDSSKQITYTSLGSDAKFRGKVSITDMLITKDGSGEEALFILLADDAY